MPRINLTVAELRLLQDATANRIDEIVDEENGNAAIENIRLLRDLSRRVEKVIANAPVEDDE